MITWPQLVVISIVASLVALVTFCVIIALNMMIEHLRRPDEQEELWDDVSEVREIRHVRDGVTLDVLEGGKR
jgi:ammonia channel protein AmtB